MKTLLAIIGLAVVLVLGVPLVLALVGLAVGILVKLVGLFLLLAIPILLVVVTLKFFAWLLGDHDRHDGVVIDDPSCRGFHRRLARMDRRMERLEEILSERI